MRCSQLVRLRHQQQHSRRARRRRVCACRLTDDAEAVRGNVSPLFPLDSGTAVTVCTRFAFLWAATGLVLPSCLAQLAGSDLSLSSRCELQLLCELLKAAATAQLLATQLPPENAAALVPRLELRAAGLGLAGAGLSLLSAGLVAGSLGPAPGELATLLSGTDVVATAAAAASACLVGPAVEEAMFRGVLFPALSARLPSPAAALLSAVVFSAAHGAAPNQSLQLLAVGGVLAGTAAAAEGNLLAPLLAHALYNAAVLGLLAA